MPDGEQGEIATKRIALRPTTFERIRDVSRGLGGSYDDLMETFLALLLEPGEDELLAGRRLRDGLHGSFETPRRHLLDRKQSKENQIAAVRQLTEFGRQYRAPVYECLLMALNAHMDGNGEVQLAIVQALRTIGNIKAVPDLLKLQKATAYRPVQDELKIAIEELTARGNI